MEETLIILKPDCLEKRIAGEVIGRFERAGFTIIATKMMQLDGTILREQNSKISVVSNVGCAEDEWRAPENRVSRKFVPASDAVAVAAHNFAHNQVEQVRRAPHNANDSIVLA